MTENSKYILGGSIGAGLAAILFLFHHFPVTLVDYIVVSLGILAGFLIGITFVSCKDIDK